MATAEPGAPVPKQGMGTATKVILILFGLGGFSMLACCGGCYMMTRNAASEDPADVLATTQEIVPILIPDDIFKPAGRFKMSIPFLATTAVVAYETVEGDGALVLFSIKAKGAIDEGEMREAMSQSTFDTGEKNLDIIRSETKTIEVAGQEVDFKFREAKDAKADKLYRQVNGAFAQGDTFVMFVVQMEEEHYDEAAILKILESIGE